LTWFISIFFARKSTIHHHLQAAAAADAKKAHAEAQLAQALEHAIAQSSSSSSGGGSPSASSAAALAAAQQEAKDLRNEVAALKLSLEEVRLECMK
jgi:hypothetical protein